MMYYYYRYGDVRVSVSHNVISLWHKLGDKKGNFIPNLVKPFLEISLIKHKGQRSHYDNDDDNNNIDNRTSLYVTSTNNGYYGM